MTAPRSMWPALTRAIVEAANPCDAWLLVHAFEVVGGRDLAALLATRRQLVDHVLDDADPIVEGPARELLELIDVAIADAPFEPALIAYYPKHLRGGL